MIDNKKLNQTIVVDTSSDLETGQNKCEKCGSTEVSLNVETGMLRCHFCRHEQEGDKFENDIIDVGSLKGEFIGSGATNIEASTDDVLTFRCTSCGAEIVVDTSQATQARCHWCRQTLSINEQIPNGAVPDKVLPFSIQKDAAETAIKKFSSSRSFFAHPVFKREFIPENIMGVYLPYMIVDANLKGNFSGQGEIETRRWTETRTVGSGDNKREQITTYYDANVFNIVRTFDMTVEGLTIESNSDKLNHRDSSHTNNVINAVKPFDISKAMKWDANFITGYTSQKRDVNVDDLRNLVVTKMSDIARHKLVQTIGQYNRGVRWTSENIEVVGKQWKAAYFPIWLYSYQHTDKTIHYVAVNGQTLKTMGSIPVNQGKLVLFSIIIGIILGIILAFLVNIYLQEDMLLVSTFSIIGVTAIYYFAMNNRYRNSNARYFHESETNASISNVTNNDTLVNTIRRTTNPRMSGDNTRAVNYKGN